MQSLRRYVSINKVQSQFFHNHHYFREGNETLNDKLCLMRIFIRPLYLVMKYNGLREWFEEKMFWWISNLISYWNHSQLRKKFVYWLIVLIMGPWMWQLLNFGGNDFWTNKSKIIKIMASNLNQLLSNLQLAIFQYYPWNLLTQYLHVFVIVNSQEN